MTLFLLMNPVPTLDNSARFLTFIFLGLPAALLLFGLRCSINFFRCQGTERKGKAFQPAPLPPPPPSPAFPRRKLPFLEKEKEEDQKKKGD